MCLVALQKESFRMLMLSIELNKKKIAEDAKKIAELNARGVANALLIGVLQKKVDTIPMLTMMAEVRKGWGGWQ
jgi:hypothetical protein